MRVRPGTAASHGDRGPPRRRIPSPDVVLSIDRRDGTDLDVSGSLHDRTRPARPLAGGRGAPHRSGAATATENGSFFFYNPEWSLNTAADAASGTSPTPVPPPLSRGGASAARDLPAPQHRDVHHHHYHRDRYTYPSDEDFSGSLDHQRGTQPASSASTATARDLKGLLRRYQAYVDGELTPQLAQLRRALAQREEECARLRADNAILAQHLARRTSAASPLRASYATTRSASPASSAGPMSHAAAEERLREAGAEIALLRRQLRDVRRITAPSAAASPQPPPLAASPPHTATPRTLADTNTPTYPAGHTPSQASATAAAAELAEATDVCRAMADDCLSFTEAHADAMERHSAGPAAAAADGKANGTTTATARTNPFRGVVEQWRRVAGVLQGLPKTAHRSPPMTAPSPAAGAASLVGPLRAVAATLQVEHRAVAACVEGLQQRAAQSEASAALHQRLVENVRREAEQRMTELEADHNAEVQTLEDAIAELEQQVRMTTASRRPWTAGLMVPRATELHLAPSSASSPKLRRSAAPSANRAEGGDHHDERGAGTVALPGSAPSSAGNATTTAAAVSPARVEGATQTDLSLEYIRAALRKAREEPARPLRREREAELVELMLAEIERLRLRLTDSRAVTARLREHQHRFLGDVTVPLSYFDGTSAAPFSAFV